MCIRDSREGAAHAEPGHAQGPHLDGRTRSEPRDGEDRDCAAHSSTYTHNHTVRGGGKGDNIKALSLIHISLNNNMNNNITTKLTKEDFLNHREYWGSGNW